MPANRAQAIQGIYSARHGKLEQAPIGQFLPPTESSNPLDPVTGVAWYYNPRRLTLADYNAGITQKSLLLVFRNRSLFAHTTSYFGNDFWLRVGSPVYVGDIGYAPPGPAGVYGGNIRTVQYRDELFIVQDRGLAPRRFVVNEQGMPALYQLGISTPAAPAAANNGAGVLTGTYRYRVTDVDEKGRESSPSVDSNAVTAAGNTVRVTFTWQNDPQVKRFDTTAKKYVYRNLNGGSVWYRVGTITDFSVTAFDDTMADATAQTQPGAPLPGENDPPKRASVACIHRGRLWLDDCTLYDDPTNVGSLNNLQVSNANAPTQFSVVTDLDRPGDGTTLTVGSDPGDEVTGLMSFGSVLGVWKRRSIHLVSGDAVSDFPGLTAFSVAPLHRRGCIAPDSLVRCDNRVLWLAEDGVYSMAYQDAWTVEKVSNEIEPAFNGYAADAQFVLAP